MRRVANRPRTLIALAALALLGAVPIVNAVRTDTASAAEAVPGDGTTSATAGASCWGIKQAFPASADGIYWLLTPSLDRPTQIWCDQTTGGGGWALVARGRDGWKFENGGQGSPASVRTNVDGPAAFAPAALSTATINDLLDNQPLSTLTDGIRIQRSTNAAGTSSQDMRWFPGYQQWTWSITPGQKLTKVTIDGTDLGASNTRDTSSDPYGYPGGSLGGAQGTRRTFTWPWSGNGYRGGFAFGAGTPSASTAASSYIYRTNNDNGLPFSRVYVRPKIANDAVAFPAVPAGGFAAETNVATLKNQPETAPWGVVGINHDGEAANTPWYTTANVVKSYGERVFVGGRFTHVQQGPGGAQTAQGSLAAFDLDGNWISTFRPQIAGRVWDMTMTADGKLIIGGDFSSVNGEPNTAGLAALDPATGAVITTWKANVTRSSGAIVVRGLDIRGDVIYAVGRFSKVQGGSANAQTVSSAVSLRASDGAPGTWKPVLTGLGVKVRAAAAGDRVYVAGYFNAVNGDTNHGYHAITDAASGTPVAGIGAWQPSIGSGAKYQQAVAESGDRILVGGSEHDFQIYDRNRTTLVDANITKSGGDTQAIEVFGDDLYVACHCDQYLFQGSNNWSNPTNFRSANTIMLVGKLSASTLQYDPTWYPAGLKGDRDDGVWSVAKDSRSCVWVAGDLVRGNTSGNAAADWLGGFGRFCPTDTTAPTTPTALKATVSGEAVNLNWGAATDASGTVSYDVYRGNRVVANVFGTTFTDSGVTGRQTYTVRAADAAGNRSGSPAPVAVNGPAPKLATPVPFGATWRYRADGTDLGTSWQAAGFDASAWASGPGKLGYGAPDLATTVSAGKPLTTYYRTSFDVADASQTKVLDLQLKVNSGAVVYVNGTEAGRVNMPTGTITATTPAAAYICCTEEARIKTVTVPGSLLVNGSNTIAVEVHGWTNGASRSFLDLQASTLGSNGDGAAPSAPTLSASLGATGTDLAWTPSSDDAGLLGYEITRDGARLAVTGPQASGYADGAVDLLVPHTYVVTAIDTNGNRTASAPVTVKTQANPNLLPYASTWRWYYQATAPAGAWNAEGYDDSAWASGAGNLGFGNGNGTVITTAPAPRPLTAYFRTTVDVADPAAFRSILLELVRDSGAAVYVNGVEVARSNLPAGALTADTFASTYVGSAARKTAVPFTLPTTAFKPGVNTIAVELHLNGRNQTTSGFDLKLTGTR